MKIEVVDREDTILFNLAAEDTVVNDTVKIVTTVAGMVTRDSTEAKLRESIRAMLNQFIDAPWQISNLTRSLHPSGREAISLNASARVSETENYALDRRSQTVSRPDDGLSISKVTTDLSFPAAVVEAAEQRLRVEIIRKAQAEGVIISAALGRDCRIRQINYDVETGGSAQFANARISASAASMKQSYGSGFSSDAGGSGNDLLGNAQKLTMTATVTLALGAIIPKT